jgi:long-chain acyl-CoA synthetase
METLRIRFPLPSMVESLASPTACTPAAGRFAGVGDASNVCDAFWRLATHGDSTALIVDGHSVSWAALRTAAWNVRRYLLSRSDFRPGALVVLRMENSAEYLAAFYGVLLAEGVVVPLSPRIEHHRWQLICRSCRPSLVITRQDGEETATELDGKDETLDVLAESLPDGATADVQRGGRDLAMILYTSGSTGTPKGAMLSHRNLLANTQSILEYLPIRRDDRALVVLPWCHAFGNSILLTHTLIGATLVLAGSTTFPVSILQALQDVQATSLSAVPELFSMLLRFARLDQVPLPHLRYMSVAGGPLSPELAEQVAAGIAPARFYVMYGQTEATARLSYLPPEERTHRRGSIGRGIPGVELRVVDDSGSSVPPGRIGRLVARGENVMLGYWRDADRSSPLLPGGWLDTGDLATVDKDGYVYLRGRANLLVKVQGHRVHPTEIEDVVKRHFPGIQAVAVPYDSAGATRLALLVIPREDQPVGERELRNVCLAELPRYKIPSRIELLDRWPLNGAMKVDRQALARWLSAQERKAC